MNIDGLGTKLVELLIDTQLVNDIGDLYLITEQQLLSLDRMGEKSANNIISAINQSKKSTLSRFIHGLGIKHIGENAAKILEKYFEGNIDKLMNISKNELVQINEIGDVMADSIVEYFSNINNREIIAKCLKNGVIFLAPKESKFSKISNKIFVFTGNLSTIKRKEAITMVEDYSGKVSNSISSKTDYVVVGDKPGSKLQKAIKNNIVILNETEFLDLIKEL